MAMLIQSMVDVLMMPAAEGARNVDDTLQFGFAGLQQTGLGTAGDASEADNGRHVAGDADDAAQHGCMTLVLARGHADDAAAVPTWPPTSIICRCRR